MHGDRSCVARFYSYFPRLYGPPLESRRDFSATVRTSWIPPRFAARTGLRKRTRGWPASRQPLFRAHAQRHTYQWLTSGSIVEYLEAADRYNAQFSVEYRCPFHDLRVIEYALAIPEEQRWRGERFKFVLRNALGGLLPDKVRNRMTKGVFDQLFADALDTHGGERLFQSPVISTLGWLDQAEILSMYRQLRYARNANQQWLPHIWPVWNAFAIESWYRTVFAAQS